MGSISFTFEVDVEPPPVTCVCATCGTFETCTLCELRARLMERLGFAAQTANPPPGMQCFLDGILQDAQRQLYRRYHALHTEIFFTWNIVENTRFLAIDADTGGGNPKLDPAKITWIGIQDANNVWYPLVAGIPPTYYTTLSQPGRPHRYEIRDQIEIFPVADGDYTLQINGHFGLACFQADDDTATIDCEAIFLHALARAKAHYRHPDASVYQTDLNDYLATLVAGQHQTRRYIPGRVELPPEPQPRFLPVEDA